MKQHPRLQYGSVGLIGSSVLGLLFAVIFTLIAYKVFLFPY